MTKISKYDLCEKCRQICIIPADEKSAGKTSEEWLDSERYNQPGIYYWGMNLVLWGHLQEKGGCPDCIKLVERATL